MNQFDLKTLKSREMFADLLKHGFGLVSYQDVNPGATSFNRAAEWLTQYEPTTPGQVLALEHYARYQDSLVLFDFRGDKPGKVGTQIVQILRLPRFVLEVEPFAPLGQDDLAIRLKLAKDTGFLLVLPCESIAISHKADGYTFVDGATNGETGEARELSGVYADNLVYRSAPALARDLDITATQKLLSNTRGHLLYFGNTLSPTDRQLYLQQIRLLEAHLPNAPQERNHNGSTIVRSFIANGDTGSTAAMRPSAEGWMRYPTSQDAWYYGVWINPRKRETLTYAEQDVTHVICETQDQFLAELKDLANFHGKSPSPSIIGFSEEGTTYFYEAMTLRDPESSTSVSFKEAGNKVPFMVDIDTLALKSALDESAQHGVAVAVSHRDFSTNLLDPRTFETSWCLTVTASAEQQVEFKLWSNPDRALHSLERTSDLFNEITASSI